MKEKQWKSANKKYKNQTTTRYWSMTEAKIGLVFFRFGQREKIFFYPPVINAEKLVCHGSYVNVVRLTLCLFLVHKGINRVIYGGTLNQAVHFQAKGFHGFGCGVQHCHSLPYQHFCVVILWKYGNQVRRETVDFLRLVCTEVIAFASALALVMLCKGI